MKHTCTKIFPEVPFAHRAPNHDGHCRFLHGHNWKLVLEFEAARRDENGFVFDFGKLGSIKDMLKAYDHAIVLNENDPDVPFYQLSDGDRWMLVTVPDCSCEGLAERFGLIASDIVNRESNGRAYVRSATLYEDEKNFATWRNE